MDDHHSAELRSALDGLRLDGAIFLRAEFSEAWSYVSPPAAMAGLLRPGAERLMLFHIVAEGECWIALEDQERHWARSGDVIVLPYGDQHWVGGVAEAECVAIQTLMPPPPWETMPVISIGEGGSPTRFICGYLHCEHPIFDPKVAAFPRVFVVTPPQGPAATWVQASITYALEESSRRLGPTSTRLPELLLMEVLRLHLASAPAAERDWLGAFHDPVLAPAITALHGDPARKWTVADLASQSSVSRSLLDERFRSVLGRSPIRYLTEWRMHIAQDLLATTELGVAAIARRVGYDAEEAFSRAFKRAHGVAPRRWREGAAQR